jgi:hypothetical protein
MARPSISEIGFPMQRPAASSSFAICASETISFPRIRTSHNRLLAPQYRKIASMLPNSNPHLVRCRQRNVNNPVFVTVASCESVGCTAQIFSQADFEIRKKKSPVSV